jgi:hypothetical protein
MNSLFAYRFDVFLARIRKKIKSFLPLPIVSEYSNWKASKTSNLGMAQILSSDIFPWTSPNIWMEIVDYYRILENPVIFEFGTGCSTIWHINELLQMKSGTYIGIENDQTWFWSVVASVLKKISLVDDKIFVQHKRLKVESPNNIDFEILTGNVKVILRLRDTIEDYVNSIDLPCDVIIVDGISRKQCVKIILTSKSLKKGGMLMLMEAGRGSKDWWEGKLEGESDYSDEVRSILRLGGIILDGNGLDNWPSCKKRSPRPVSYYYPMEACRLILK